MKPSDIKSKLYPYAQLALALIFPPRCPSCDIVTGTFIEGKMCGACRAKYDEEFVSECPSCGHRSDKCCCTPDILGNDADRSPYTDIASLIFSGYYTGYDDGSVISALVYKMKRDHASGAKLLFADIIAQSVSRTLLLNKLDPKNFTVTYIPRGEISMAKYGFDHMRLVSKRVAKMLGCKHDSLLVNKGGATQKELTAKERTDNAYNNISVDPKKKDKINGSKIILLDDIITTGSSMRAAVSKLSLAGANTIIPSSAMISIKNKGEENT